MRILENVRGIIGIVKGKKAVIVDDFTITGYSLIETAQMLLQRGATEVCAMVTHGILAPGAAQRIEDSPIKQLIITDTIERRYEPLTPKIQVISVAPWPRRSGAFTIARASAGCSRREGRAPSGSDKRTTHSIISPSAGYSCMPNAQVLRIGRLSDGCRAKHTCEPCCPSHLGHLESVTRLWTRAVGGGLTRGESR